MISDTARWLLCDPFLNSKEGQLSEFLIIHCTIVQAFKHLAASCYVYSYIENPSLTHEEAGNLCS